MAEFIFDQNIFQKKFIRRDGFRNYAKSTESDCDSMCPNSTDGGNVYKGYTSIELLADTLHNVFGEVISAKKSINIEDDLKSKLLGQLEYNDDENLKTVFWDLMQSIYFDFSNRSHGSNAALLRYLPASRQKDFGKFIYDVFLDNETKTKLSKAVKQETNLLDEMVNSAYNQMNILQKISPKQEYSRVFNHELEELFVTMNMDFRAALDGGTDAMQELEFLFTYYLFIYMSQVVLRVDLDLQGKIDTENKNTYPMFKGAKETVSEDRECVNGGWRRIEKKMQKLFMHMIVLNMLNCHTNETPYLTYSELYTIYSEKEVERQAMDRAVDHIIDRYTKEFQYDTDISGVCVDFSQLEYPSEADPVIQFKKKVIYLCDCVALQLDSNYNRKRVISYVITNYNHIFKMRFVKSWGQLGHMMMITNDDLITMISICQRTSSRMNDERGIQISDLFEELEKRGLCMDGKTKQYVIDYLVQTNLIDSKCDSEEAQYVKRIQ